MTRRRSQPRGRSQIAVRFTGEVEGGLPVFVPLHPVRWPGVTVPAGARCNGASLPRIWRGVIAPTDPRLLRASIIHDYLYSGAVPVSRYRADCIYLAIVLEDGLHWFRAIAHFIALRCFGASNFTLHKPNVSKK